MSLNHTCQGQSRCASDSPGCLQPAWQTHAHAFVYRKVGDGCTQQLTLDLQRAALTGPLQRMSALFSAPMMTGMGRAGTSGEAIVHMALMTMRTEGLPGV